MNSEDRKYLKRAIELASESAKQGGFPAGAVVVKDGEIVGEGLSIGFRNNDPTGHAESVAIREACKKLETANLRGATLYESAQSCLMCYATSFWGGIEKIVYAAKKTPEMVEKYYYEGTSDTEKINRESNRIIELVHMPEMEEDALKVIKEWEEEGGFSKTE